jgi:aminoglycoside phosphotransferase (APT) family kinase protein
MGFRLAHSPGWLEHFRRAGYPDVQPLGAGVEGAVYRLGNGTVAKVWGRRRTAELLLWQAFYASLAAAGLPFATPVILGVDEVRGSAVTVERELPGRPLQAWLDTGARRLDGRVTDAILGVLRALATVPGTAALRGLPVLDERRAFRRDGEDFPGALSALLERRTARFGDLLRSRVPDFDRRYAAVIAGLAALDRRPDAVVHGDLFGENVLVDASGRPSAVLDFGFLTTAGDPRFDAAVTAAIMNMYGTHAGEVTEALTGRLAVDLGHPADVLRLYRAAYAIATSNAFTDDGTDGHFAWCVRQLTAPGVSAALGVRRSPD